MKKSNIKIQKLSFFCWDIQARTRIAIWD